MINNLKNTKTLRMRYMAEHFDCVSILRSPCNLTAIAPTAHLQVVAWLPTSLVFVEFENDTHICKPEIYFFLKRCK